MRGIPFEVLSNPVTSTLPVSSETNRTLFARQRLRTCALKCCSRLGLNDFEDRVSVHGLAFLPSGVRNFRHLFPSPDLGILADVFTESAAPVSQFDYVDHFFNFRFV